MTESWFRVEGVHHTTAFRSRSAYVGHQTFGHGDGAVLVESAAARELRAAAEQALPKETGGLLFGRTWSDENGHYILVDGFVQAAPDAGRLGGFQLATLETVRLREEAARRYPTADEVGWWHSHSRPSPYSRTDLDTQQAFERPDSVGLLVFASGLPWATAYRGPGALHLGEPVELTATGASMAPRDDKTGVAAPSAPHNGQRPSLTRPHQVPPSRRPRRRWWPLWRPRPPTVLGALAAVVIAVIVAIVVTLTGNVHPEPLKLSAAPPSSSARASASMPASSAAHDPSSPAPSPTPTLTGKPQLRYSNCERSSNVNDPGTYYCYADVLPPAWSARTRWVNAAGKTVATGVQATIKVTAPEQVHAVIVTNSGPYIRGPVKPLTP